MGEDGSRRGSRAPVMLVILDGWGLRTERDGNAVALADTPVFDRLWRTCPRTQLHASGREVGLPEGQMGNSEVGHLTIGAGRIVLQDMTRIDDAIETGEFFDNPVLVAAVDRAREAKRPDGRPAALHIMGLLSDGGVHSHIRHCFALLELARRRGARNVLVHVFSDGRDTSPTGGAGYLRELLEVMQRTGLGRLATVVGRYYAMDRDRRWERTKIAYDALALRLGERTDEPVEAIEESYRKGVTDEFLMPLITCERGAIESGDGVIFFNFRADRARQLMRALVDPAFDRFPRPASPLPALDGPAMIVRHIATLARYGDDLHSAVAFPRQGVTEGFGELVSGAGLRQLRTAETEKYAHVTYFFNGGLEQPWEGEGRLLVPSPKVATYDLKPDMSAPEVTGRLIGRIREERPDVVVLNYANPDMVGHTGDLHAAIAAVEAVDRELGRLLEAFPGKGLIIADHGNAETMIEPDGTPHTAHTTNPVPCILLGAEPGTVLREGGGLRDVAPTLLGLLGIELPAAMTGRDLRSPAGKAEPAALSASSEGRSRGAATGERSRDAATGERSRAAVSEERSRGAAVKVEK